MITSCLTPLEERAGCPWVDRPVPTALVGEQDHGCYADTDHIVAQKYRFMGLLIRKYIDTPENKQQLCRGEHDNKDDEAVAVPSEEFMLNAVHAAWRSGDLRLNGRQYNRLFAVGPEEAA